MSQAPLVSCPHCKKSALWDSANLYRPFCCERCKMIDLGKWANEEYRVEQAPDINDFLDAESNPSLTQ
jgi:endogenous inhibitor of DNA gyrase (YacG/DUF329 family)